MVFSNKPSSTVTVHLSETLVWLSPAAPVAGPDEEQTASGTGVEGTVTLALVKPKTVSSLRLTLTSSCDLYPPNRLPLLPELYRIASS